MSPAAFSVPAAGAVRAAGRVVSMLIGTWVTGPASWLARWSNETLP